MKIGFFDSGIGGITVLKEALEILPGADYLYYADTSNAPYGTKDKTEVKKYIFKAVDFMVNKDIVALVVACNTATSIAIKELRNKYEIPIIGMEPAVKPAVENNQQKKVLVTATPLTIKEEKFKELVAKVDAEDIVDALALPKLVEFAEKSIFDKTKVLPYLKDELADYNLKQYGTLVLGCTHFSFYKTIFAELLPDHITIIDGNHGTIKHLENTLKKRGISIDNTKQGQVEFYSSGEKREELQRYIKIL